LAHKYDMSKSVNVSKGFCYNWGEKIINKLSPWSQ